MTTACFRFMLAAVAGVLLASPFAARAERIKDIATVAGVRGNQLIGYGLVVGLDGTGDQTSQTPFTIQAIKNMLAQLGVLVPDNVNPQLRNVAAVTVQATLPAFAKPGQTLDITVSSIGNAQSQRGGSLVMAPLRGADGQIYAMAQGNLIVGGFGVQGDDGSRVSVNVPSTGRIPNGATVERMVPTALGTTESLVLNLNAPDFTTAARLTESINASLGAGTAESIDAISVRVRAPAGESDRVAYLSHIENLEVVPAAAAAKVIVNSRTGTVVPARAPWTRKWGRGVTPPAARAGAPGSGRAAGRGVSAPGRAVGPGCRAAAASAGGGVSNSRATASSWEPTSSLARIEWIWVRTVDGATTNCAAIPAARCGE